VGLLHRAILCKNFSESRRSAPEVFMTLETDVDKFISTICKTPASLQNENNFNPGVKSNHAYDKHTF
jgi:hypothetical protein